MFSSYSSPRLHRRQFLSNSGTCAATVALSQLLSADGLLADEDAASVRPRPTDTLFDTALIDPARPLLPRPSHFRPRAQRLLVIFCNGGLSQVDSWDFKPELIKRHDKPHPETGKLVLFQSTAGALKKSYYPFRPRGEAGKMVTDLLPRLAELADWKCFLHAMVARSNSHGPAEIQMGTGSVTDGFPSAGAWVSYALGSENENLPAFVSMPDARGGSQAGANIWGSGFLPASFQGTKLSSTHPVQNLRSPEGMSRAADRAARDLLGRLNESHLARDPSNSELRGRIASYELAAKMQLSVPELMSLNTESPETIKQYGADSRNEHKSAYAKNCILARRLLERGVRVVQLINGTNELGTGNGNWDGHTELVKQYKVHAEIFDQPTAALLIDMKQRGLLDDTLVLWLTEFGRMPMFQGGSTGRDHNPYGFTIWMMGAGVKAPYSFGSTDEFGFRAVENVTSIADMYATVLHMMGLNHRRLAYRRNGTMHHLSDPDGKVIEQILA